MQALLWGILNTHVNALCLRAAFTRLAVLVVQVGAARQAGLLYGSGRCMIRQWLEDRAMCSGKGHTTCNCTGAKSEHCTAGMNGDGCENLGVSGIVLDNGTLTATDQFAQCSI